MGARDPAKGEAAIKAITDECPEAAGKIEVLEIDVSNDASCAAAAASLKAKGVTLYALCNNAGMGLAQGEAAGATTEQILNTNYLGPKRVTDAMAELIDSTEGRIVHTSSGGASMWLKTQDAETKALFSNPDLTLDALNTAIQEVTAAGKQGWGNGYGFSKACLTALTLIQAKAYPNLKVVSMSPGFIDTAMTSGFGARLSPEQGCVSGLVCLFNPVTSGWYYGSDGLRSPLTMTRDPGMPEYEGEADPDQAKYNK
jgi:NAD(P)-dependent dehydrogenase (short-subunit alcohol dehydrogenase family)